MKSSKRSRNKPGALRRRKSSGIGGELPGDNIGGSLATLSPRSPQELQHRTSEKSGKRSKRRTVKRFFRRWKAMSFKHTWVNPLILCLLIVSLYLVYPYPSNPISAALFLSYPIPLQPGSDGPIQYGKGSRDFAFVGFYIIFLTFTREFFMQRVIRPMAIRAGIRSRTKQARFMEQSYTAIYFGIFGPYGLWVMSRTSIWYFNTTAMYEGYPHLTHEAVFKAYYLLQAAYWAQQMIVMCLMLEKPRKDFKELVMHHFITLALIWLSYRFHFTHMGIAIYITMDISDFFLATSKVINYLDWPIVGPYFVLFVFVWTYLRHFINLKVLYSILTEFNTVGPFELNWETQQYKCRLSQVITFGLLAALQAVNLFWLFMIARIAYRFVANWGKEIADERSDYEDTGDEAINEREDSTNANVEKTQPKLNGHANGASNGKLAAGATPQVMLNGEPVARTPSPAGRPATPDTIKTRLRKKKTRS
ncbi:putative ceramide synthase membrane component [Mytilinidion resinicola]|uniref:Ceramide synthase membrane component n=1 Tax=Mytilinidion resinicola TaxID=574789 RepID=A0A6A6Z881_9PEZI|nr:putative ceramide synthase membrane component [Mytilinidion resinicola]KAF2816933.1 putative ceramide synthase membrane component [Mytilinidion resinicola]